MLDELKKKKLLESLREEEEKQWQERGEKMDLEGTAKDVAMRLGPKESGNYVGQKNIPYIVKGDNEAPSAIDNKNRSEEELKKKKKK